MRFRIRICVPPLLVSLFSLLIVACSFTVPATALAQAASGASQREAQAVLRVAPLTAPAIGVAPTSFEESLLTGEVVTRTLSISNAGDTDLLFQILVDAEPGPVAPLPSPAAAAALQLRLQENAAAHSSATDGRAPALRPDQTETSERDLLSLRAGVYTGDYLHFGISALGEVMPFQHPVGVEHLNVSAPRSGYTLAYASAGSPALAYAGYESRLNVESVSYSEIVNTASQVVAEAVARTTDGKLEIVRRFTFHRDERFVRIRTGITNISGAPLEGVVFKGWADWDIDGDSNDDDWDYDFARNLILGSDANYVGLASFEVPTYMDIDGWNDWHAAPTIVDFPAGPVENFDGLTLLHFDVGDLADGATESFTTVFAAGADLAQLRQAVDRGLALWLSADPVAGAVPAGGQAGVDVTFAATRLFGGDYLGELVIESNDPVAPQTIVPAVLHVTGVPAIVVSPEELVFQPLIAGIAKRDTVWVTNPGTGELIVDAIWIDGPPAFTVTPSSLTVPFRETRPVVVTLTPPTVALITATLNLQSDDPERPLVQVPLTGQPPYSYADPVIAVTPDSFDVSLWTGETATETLTIENIGGDVLDWSLAFVPRLGSPLRGAGGGSPLAAADLTGMRILYDRSRGQLPPDPWTLLISDLEARGATVEVQWSRLTPSHLADFDVLWSTNARGTWSTEERAAVHDWLIAGGSILLEGDTDPSVLNFNALLEWLESGIHYSLWDGAVGITGDVVSHPATAGVDSVYLAPGAHLEQVDPPGFPLVRDIDGRPIVACQELGFGRLVAMSDEVLRIEQVDNVALGGRVFDWFAAPRWVSADRMSGSVPSGSADDVQITFDAGYLFGGDYRAELVITSNDFVTPRVSVGARLHVTGAPDVKALPDSIDFGPVFVTTSAADTVRISNAGTDTLFISDISLQGPTDFQLAHTIGNLAPGQFGFLYVTFTPSTEASFSGEVRITSNDPDEPVLPIPLTGEGLFPPQIQVTPDSLIVDAVSGDIVLRTVTIGNVGANQLIWSLVAETSNGGPWLSAAPVSGVVAAGTVADVTVTFDTNGLLQGDYEGSLTVTSNDPATPEVVVGVLLRVTGIPNITVTPSSLDYGPVFIGAVVQDSVRVRNTGTGPLAVTAVAVEGSSDFSVSASPFVLEPFASQYVTVHFAPSVVGAITANLRLDSDDPDQPVTLVPLAGEGLVAPVIGVTPDSLDVELFVGEMMTDTLTISNTGGNDLVWEISVRPPATLGAHLSAGESREAASGEFDGLGAALREEGSLEGVQILWPRGHSELFAAAIYATMIGELEARGATVTESYDPLTPALLANYHIVWSVEVQSPWVGNELHDLAAWVLNGGSLMIEGDGDVAVAQYNALFSELGAGIVMSTSNGVAARTTNIHPHPTTVGVTRIDLLGPRASLERVDWPAVRLVDDAGAAPAPPTPNVAACALGAGRIVVAAEQLLHPQNITNPDNILFGNQIFDWLAALTWLRPSLWSGIVTPGSSTDVEVVLDATGMNGGDYFARLAITSNDPLTPRFDVGVHLHVTGVPDIDVTPLALDFGRVHVGGSAAQSLTVANVGTDTLFVTEIAVDGSAQYGVTPESMVVPPGQADEVVVSFTPVAAESVIAVLRLVSNDPDESPLYVDLVGVGYLPPVIVVEPDSLGASLISGQTSVQTLTIGNTGPGELEWEIEVRNHLRGDLAGVDILWDRSRGQSSTSTWSTLIGDLQAQGATVTESTSSLTLSHLAAYDILWTINAWSSWTLAEREAVRDWVLAGGALILEGNANAAVVAFNDLLTTVGVGVQYSTTNGVSGITTNIEPHQMTVGVDSLDLGTAGAHLSVVTSPAATVVRDVAGNAMVACEEIAAGRVVAMAAKIQSNDNINSAHNRVFGNRVFPWLAGPLWLTAEPTSGTVPSGDSTDVTVTMDATGLHTGTYEADLAVTSNDPITPEVRVPVTIDVTGVQDIAVSPDSLFFGEVYLGVTARDTVVVMNVGTEVLEVTDVSVSGPPNFTASATAFQLQPGEGENIEVEFLPTEPISYVGALLITSDDPDEPVVDVALLGQGSTPPVIAVNPDSIGVSLYPGGEHTEPLVITNNGGSSLEWQISLDLNPGALPRGRLADLTGVRILWPRGHSELFTPAAYVTMVGELEARGATVTESFDLLTPGLLATFDIVWSVEVRSPWIGNELADLAAWIRNGGSLMIEGDGDVAVTQYNALLSELAAGVEMSTVNGTWARTTNIHPHPTTEGVTSIDLLAPNASLGTVATPAVRLVDDAGAIPKPNVAAAEVGTGRIVVAAEQLLHPQNIGSADNVLFGNQIFDWLAKAGWLDVEPKYGTTAAGNADSLAVAINARRIPAGDYDADIVVTSNDPITPEERVAVHLHVIGAPDIGVSPPSLAFGSVFVGGLARDTIWVSNVGTETLVVSSIEITGDDAFLISPSSLTISPGGTEPAAVTFAPVQVGPHAATADFTSNDPDEPIVVVPLDGEGVTPPVIGVTPDSLAASLFSGESEDQLLTIANSGGSDLDWSLRIEHVTVEPQPDAHGLRGSAVLQETGELRAAEYADLAGVDILWPRGHGELWGPSGYGVLVTQLVARGATITESSEALTPGLLAGYDIVWSVEPTTAWLAGELEAVADWIRAGGSFMVEVDGDAGTADYNELFSELVAGIEMSTVNGVYATTTNIHPHTMTRGVTSIDLLNPRASLAQVDWPAFRLVDDAAGTPNVAATTVGAGRIAVAAEQVFHPQNMGNPDNVVLGNQVFDWLARRQWLEANLVAGTIGPGATQNVVVTFHSAGLVTGDYAANIVIESNDPLTPEVTVPATMHVTGAGHIEVFPTSLDFGSVYVNVTAELGLQVVNLGTEVLNVSSITVEGEPTFLASHAALVLQPGESRTVTVSFTPTAVTPYTGVIHLESDDPNRPLVDVPLSGEGVLAPVIGVSPDSLGVDLYAGNSETRLLTISNTGGSPLDWTLHIELVMPVPAARDALRNRGAAAPDSAPAGPPPIRRGADAARDYGDLTGVDILWPMGHDEWWSSSTWETMIGQLEARGATVTESSELLTPELLADYDIVWSVEIQGTWHAGEVENLVNWIRAGGSMMIEGDGDPAVAAYNELFTELGAGIEMSIANGRYGTTANIHPHPTTEGVTSVDLLGPRASLAGVQAPAVRLVDDVINVPNVAACEVEVGRVVVAAEQLLHPQNITNPDNLVFGNQIFDWLAGFPWISVDVSSGSVEAGGSQDVTVTFDSAGLTGGTYAASLVVRSNDPVAPEVVVPAVMHVSGDGNIQVSPLSLDFGQHFVGSSSELAIHVSNSGNDLLNVYAITVEGDASFTVAPSSLILEPGESCDVVVTFAPTTPALCGATVHLDSDDPDEPRVDVLVSGEGIPAPEITVSPDTVRAAVAPGASTTELLTIGNTGGHELEFSLVITGGTSRSGRAGRAVEISARSESIASLSSGARVGEVAAPAARADESRSLPPNQTASALRGNEPGAPQAPLTLRGTYSGDHIHFGITNYGEIMPFQHPPGNEHLDVLTRMSGYTVSYFVGGSEVTAYAATEVRSGITPVSYETLQSSPEGVIVQVVTRTTEGSLKITRTFFFATSDRFVRVATRLDNEGGTELQGLIFKSYADWDMDGDFADDSFAYDTSRHMIGASDVTHAAVASYELPDLMDIDGWGDYDQRETFVDITAPSVSNYDGMPILHFELGTLLPGAVRGLTTAFAGGMDLQQLNEVVDGALEIWLSAAPLSGIVPPAASAEITLTMDATDLDPGEYDAIIRIASNDPVAPTTIVPVYLTVATTVGCEPGASPPTAVMVDLPREFALHPNAPNPFVRSTALRFDLPVPSSVSLRIFNVQGRLVRTFIDEQVEAGRHLRHWDGRDNRGCVVAAGVYFYRMEAGSFERTRKMILLSRP